MNLIYRFYFFIPKGFFGYRFDSFLYSKLKLLFDLLVVNYLNRKKINYFYALNIFKREKKIICSLTSFPDRIDTIWICIETLMRQTLKPDKIILWLAKEQFPQQILPDSLLKLENKGLSIRWCDEDLRSHKKYYYAFQEFPNDIIITFDDDVYYPNNTIEELYKIHIQYPNCICSNKVNKMLFEDNNLLPYNNWNQNYNYNLLPSYDLVQIGVSGVLYPPNIFTQEVLKKEVFTELCFYADDLWLKVCSLINKKKVVTSRHFNKELISIGKTQDVGLYKNNLFNNGNDFQLNNLIIYYKLDLFNLFFKE